MCETGQSVQFELNASIRSLKRAGGRAVIERRQADAALAIERKSFADGVSSKSDLENAEFAAQLAASGVASAGTAIDERRATLETLEALLRDSTLRAPITGVISMRYAEVGARVTEGAPLVRVISDGDVLIKFAMPAGQSDGIVVGSMIAVEVPGQALPLQAMVTAVSPELDPIAQMILAEASPNAGAHVPQPGTVCHIVVP